jgi:hypothetical protein
MSMHMLEQRTNFFLALLNVPSTYMHKVGQFNYQNIEL